MSHRKKHDKFFNDISLFFVVDVIISVVIIIIVGIMERLRKHIKHSWSPVVALLTQLVLFLGLSLLLYLRGIYYKKS